MLRALLFFLLSASVGLAEGDWRQSLTPVAPGKFPIPPPVRLRYSFGWSGFTAGRCDATFSRQPDNRLRLDVHGGTIGFVRVLWRLDALHIALADADTLLPVSVRQLEVYRGESLRTNLDFSSGKVTCLREKKPPTKRPPRPEQYSFPNLRDLHSTLLFMRSMRLQTGDTYSIVSYPTSAPYLVTAAVSGRETLRVAAGKFNAIRVDLKLWRINKDFSIEPNPKCKHVCVWVTDDASRIPIRARADIFIGSVWAELEKVNFVTE